MLLSRHFVVFLLVAQRINLVLHLNYLLLLHLELLNDLLLHLLPQIDRTSLDRPYFLHDLANLSTLAHRFFSCSLKLQIERFFLAFYSFSELLEILEQAVGRPNDAWNTEYVLDDVDLLLCAPFGLDYLVVELLVEVLLQCDLTIMDFSL